MKNCMTQRWKIIEIHKSSLCESNTHKDTNTRTCSNSKTQKQLWQDFPAGPVAENPPASARSAPAVPGQELRPHRTRSYWASTAQLWKFSCSGAHVPQSMCGKGARKLPRAWLRPKAAKHIHIKQQKRVKTREGSGRGDWGERRKWADSGSGFWRVQGGGPWDLCSTA